MSNFLEYTLSLNDMISSKLRKIGINNDMMNDKFSKLRDQAKEVSDGFKYMGVGISTLQQKVALLKAERDLLPIESLSTIRKYNSEIGKLEGNISKLETLNGSKVKTWFSDALNGLPGIATNPLVLLGAGIGASVKKGMEADMQKSNILTLLKGDAEKATKLYDDLSKYGVKSPYDKAGLIDAQQTMMSFGLTADDSFTKLKQIGDIALGDANKMQALSLAFAQASSTGKLNGQDLNQMINAGFNPLLVISEKTGESMSSLKDRMSKGTLTIEELSGAFETATSKGGSFYGAADKASQTLGGKWSNMMESFSELALKVYAIVGPIISPMISLITTIMEAIGNGIGNFIEKIKSGNPYIIIIAGVITSFVSALILHNTYMGLATMWQNRLTFAVLKSNLAFLANPVTWVIASVIALIAVIAYLIYKVDGWGEAWKHTIDGSNLLLQAFVEDGKFYFTSMVDNMMIDINRIKEGWYKFKNAVGLGDSSENAQMIEQIRSDTEARQKAIEEGAKKVNELYANSNKEFALAGGSLKWNDKSLSDVAGGLMSKLGISAPVIPGTTLTKDNTGDASKDKAAKTNEAIATGGTKNTTINISFKNMMENTQISKAGFKESVSEMEDQLQNALLRVLAMANTTAG